MFQNHFGTLLFSIFLLYSVELTRKKLAKFGLSVQNHIFGVVSNGASMMKKFARLLGTEHQICHAHGLHLSVSDILYKHIEDNDNGYKKSKISFSSMPYTAPFWPANRTDELSPLSRFATRRKGV